MNDFFYFLLEINFIPNNGGKKNNIKVFRHQT